MITLGPDWGRPERAWSSRLPVVDHSPYLSVSTARSGQPPDQPARDQVHQSQRHRRIMPFTPVRHEPPGHNHSPVLGTHNLKGPTRTSTCTSTPRAAPRSGAPSPSGIGCGPTRPTVSSMRRPRVGRPAVDLGTAVCGRQGRGGHRDPPTRRRQPTLTGVTGRADQPAARYRPHWLQPTSVHSPR